jgi:hypothetical protein
MDPREGVPLLCALSRVVQNDVHCARSRFVRTGYSARFSDIDTRVFTVHKTTTTTTRQWHSPVRAVFEVLDAYIRHCFLHFMTTCEGLPTLAPRSLLTPCRLVALETQEHRQRKTVILAVCQRLLFRSQQQRLTTTFLYVHSCSICLGSPT